MKKKKTPTTSNQSHFFVSNQKFDPDAHVIPAHSYRELVYKSFDDDWNTRRSVIESSENDIVTIRVTFSFQISAPVAKQLLEDFLKK